MDERAICRRSVKSSQRAAASLGASPKVMYPLSSTCALARRRTGTRRSRQRSPGSRSYVVSFRIVTME